MVKTMSPASALDELFNELAHAAMSNKQKMQAMRSNFHRRTSSSSMPNGNMATHRPHAHSDGSLGMGDDDISTCRAQLRRYHSLPRPSSLLSMEQQLKRRQNESLCQIMKLYEERKHKVQELFPQQQLEQEEQQEEQPVVWCLCDDINDYD